MVESRYNALNDFDNIKLTLVMPVLNEGVKIIPTICTLAFTLKIPTEILVVYDDDNDPTLNVINEFCGVFKNLIPIRNEGIKLIGAIKTGFKKSRGKVVGIWVPYHVDPYGLLNIMYRLIDSEDCVVVSGNRFNRVKRISRGGLIKKLLSRGGNYFLNRVLGIPFGDVTTSIKLYKKSFLENVEIKTKISGGWSLSTELAIKAAFLGCKLGEVEFKAKNTNMIIGVSNFNVLLQIGSYLKWLFWGYYNRETISKNYSGNEYFIRIE